MGGVDEGEGGVIANANALTIPLADKSIHSIITSPPYFGLRDYGVDGQIGLEENPAEYVEKLRQFGREAWRVLRDDGTLWLNLGDSYASGEIGRNDSVQGRSINGKPVTSKAKKRQQRRVKTSLPPKSLIGIPWRVAFALMDDGWILRNEIIWSKPNGMPESVTDRFTKAHEHVFLFSKEPRYYFDQEAVKEDATGSTTGAAASFKRNGSKRGESVCPSSPVPTHRDNRELIAYDGPTRNRRTVWEVATAPYSGAHFACWPPALVEPMVKASTSERGVCPVCGAAWVRVVEKSPMVINRSKRAEQMGEFGRTQSSGTMVKPAETKTTGWRPTCDHEAEPIPAIVLDPFCGSGTTGEVCRTLGRDFIGLDLNPEYLGRLALPRAERKQVQAALNGLPLFAMIEATP